MSRAQKVSRPFRSRLSVFLNESHPGRDGRPIAIDGTSTGSEHLEYIRQMRSGKVAQPTAERAWVIGGTLSRVSGKRWLNPVVMLFVCGHYEEVAALFIRACNSGVDLARILELARALPGVVSSEAGVRPKLKDELAIREAQDWDRDLPATDSLARRIWSIDGETFSAFSEGWRARHSTLPPFRGAAALINGCAVIANHAEYPVVDRDHHVAVLLTDGLLGNGL